MTEDMTPLEREWKLHIILGDIRYLVREYIRLSGEQHPGADPEEAHFEALQVANYATFANDDPWWDWYRQEADQIFRRMEAGEE